MKKIILAGLLLAVGSVAMANSAQDVLKKARDDYYKQQEAERKAAKAPKKVERVKTETAEGVEEVEAADVEKELDGYNEVLGKKKSKKVKEQKAKTEKTKKAKK